MSSRSPSFTFSHHPHSLLIPRKPEAKRSSKWPALRKKWIKAHPNCAMCGSSKSLEVHHIIPVHIDPTLELDTSNLLTLCEGKTRICHYIFGHLYDWKRYNKLVMVDVATLSPRFNLLQC